MMFRYMIFACLLFWTIPALAQESPDKPKRRPTSQAPT
jgi:hypothetical protein